MTLEIAKPKFISFDVYGTLIYFEMRKAVEQVLSERLTAEEFESFIRRFRANRFDEILEYLPYEQVLEKSFRRTCEQFEVDVDSKDVEVITNAIFSWGPHSDVPAPLAKMADHYPLVALSNADRRHLDVSIPRLGAPFHRVISAEEVGAYKPRLKAFDYMIDALDAPPTAFLHIAAHQIYDHIPMQELGFTNKVYLDRGYEPDLPQYGAIRVTSLNEVNEALGIN